MGPGERCKIIGIPCESQKLMQISNRGDMGARNYNFVHRFPKMRDLQPQILNCFDKNFRRDSFNMYIGIYWQISAYLILSTHNDKLVLTYDNNSNTVISFITAKQMSN